MTPAVPHHRPADGGAGLARRGFVRHAGQGFQIAAVGRGRDLRPAPQLAHAPLQGPPGFLPARVALLGAIDAEVLGFVDGGFNT